MASSSSFTSCDDTKRYHYDVFLSFSGEDTRKTFVDHLNEALQRHGIRTFKDDERLQKGKEIKDELMKSIDDSKFFIIIFSKNYASSSWCLDELVKIIDCHKTTDQTAFPLFYDVEPTEVRTQSGSVGEAFARHTKKVVVKKTLTRTVGKALARHSNKKLGKWRIALKDAANLSGWELKNTAHGHEAKVIKLIVERISFELRSSNVEVDENLVGMERRMQDLERCLEIGMNDVRVVGIKGMGGAGKTTLARAIFDKLSIDFEGKSFVENVRENSKASFLGLKKLQEQVLIDLLKDTSISVSSVHEGTHFMKTRLHSKKVLIILDDVNHVNQLEELAGDPSWFKPGSRVIITTRDESLLNTYTVKWIYDVNLLSIEEALRLFSRHAFRKNTPAQEYESQSHEVVRYAGGLPLTIKVLGSLLCGKNKSEWIDAIARLKKVPSIETLKILELSYESLEDDYKKIFLNVACFLRYWRKDHAITLLESCGFHAIIGLRVLEEKSLIKIEGTFGGGDISMHDRIVEMGENIIRRKHPDEPNRHSHLWVEEEIKHVLASHSVNEETMYMSLKFTPDIVLEGFRNLKRLRCLIVNYSGFHISHDHPKIDELPYFPDSLQYLCWHVYPYRCLPETFKANNLVALEMFQSKIEQLWEGGKVMKQLKFLNLSYSKLLRSLDLGLTPNLERLKLKDCGAFVKLYLHDGKVMNKLKVLSLGSTKLRSLDLRLTPNLERLKLEGCGALVKLYLHDGKVMNKLKVLSLGYTKLRSLDLGSMPNLERLLLPYCADVVKLYVHSGCLKSLLYLDICGCYNLESFLFIEQLESLEVLHTVRLNLRESPDYKITWHSNNSLQELCLSNEDIEELPSSIGNLHKLVSIVLHGCYKLKYLPGSICSLQHLRTLKVKFCGIEELPKDIGRLECLETLDSTSAKLKHLPHSICMLKCLKTLILNSCSVLEKLPEDVGQLESLVELNLKSCKDLRDIPTSICNLKHLKMLMLEGCKRLEKLPDRLEDLKCLQELYIQNTRIIYLPLSISLLKGLKIYRSELKDQILDDDFIHSLCSKYDSEKCQILGFQHPRTLDLRRCGIKELPEALGHLECLEELNLSYTDIKHLPDSICMLKHLKKLFLERCVLLEKLPNDVGRLESLEKLDLSRCYSVREIPSSICMLKQLKIVDLYHCFCLEKLPADVGRLESLEDLDITRCYNIGEIPSSVGMLKHLKKLKLEGCRRLEKLPDEVGVLECLQELNIWDTGISRLPRSISSIRGLKICGFISID